MSFAWWFVFAGSLGGACYYAIKSALNRHFSHVDLGQTTFFIGMALSVAHETVLPMKQEAAVGTLQWSSLLVMAGGALVTVVARIHAARSKRSERAPYAAAELHEDPDAELGSATSSPRAVERGSREGVRRRATDRGAPP